MRHRITILAFALSLMCCASTRAQPAARASFVPPHIGYVYPAGGQQGSSCVVTVGGQNLEAARLFTGTGITARLLNWEHPVPQREFQSMRETAEKLQARRKAAGGRFGTAWTMEEDKALREFRERLALGPANRQANPVISERATFEVTIAPDAAPGPHEMRILAAGGISNPLTFVVGQLAEFGAPAAKPAPMKRGDGTSARSATASAPALDVKLPGVVNGQILPGEVDRVRFAAKRGQRIVVAVAARSLIPYLADAVPGWFQATVGIVDGEGRQLAFADDFGFNPDPSLLFEIPRDGEYTVEIADAMYRGREDFVYRLTLGEVPFITGVFPLGGAVGGVTEVALSGWNLPAEHIRIDGREQSSQECLISVRRNGVLSNAVPFAFEAGPEYLEHEEPGDASAQMVPVPTTINGRIESDDDADVYTVSGQPGHQVVAEVFARRLGSPLDAIVRITDVSGRELAANDDAEDRGSALTTHHADSRVQFAIPADGTCLVSIGDAQHRGGLDFAYRLRLAPPQPDFEVRLTPSSITVPGGLAVPVTAHILRHDGFSGAVVLTLSNAPAGLSVSGARIPAGQNSVRFTVHSAAVERRLTRGVTFEARADVDGRPIVRRVTPADDLMQAFAYRHLAPARAIVVDVVPRGPRTFKYAWRGSPDTVHIANGGTGRVRCRVPSVRGDGALVFELSEAPEGIALSGRRLVNDTVDLTFTAEAGRLAVGHEGNLIVQMFLERPISEDAQGKKSGGVRRIPLGVLPAISFQVVAK